MSVSGSPLEARLERLIEIRQWGTTEAAEATARAVVQALALEKLQRLGIFASEVDEEMEFGSGGIHFQSVPAEGIFLVEIEADGAFGDAHGIDGLGALVEAEISTPAEAAAWLERLS